MQLLHGDNQGPLNLRAFLFHTVRRAFTVAWPLRLQRFAAPQSSPVRILHGAFSP